MQTMKIIDLLNTNDKPKKIQYKNYIWILDENSLYDNKDIAIDLDVYISSVQVCDLGRNLIDVLNDEVEIIEDKPRFEIDDTGYIHTNNGAWKGRKMDIEFAKAINYLLEKSDKSE
ncbi:MAG: hypothetical protein HFI86_02115 [Bacilli bacterium]|nr:hypothetical protein [Bacilli bacterium]